LPDWITTQEAAELPGYDLEHVRRLARQGKIGAVKKGRDWWIDVEKFPAYLNTMLESDEGRAGLEGEPKTKAFLSAIDSTNMGFERRA
jgi:excisionase family DNA binding protein